MKPSISRQDIPKLYYSIGQVSRMTEVDQHVLRYWETEFKELAPRKGRNGKRLYREIDVRMILRIKELLYRERYTIEGARRRLKEEAGEFEADSSGSSSRHSKDAHYLVTVIRKELLEIRDLLNR